MKKTKVTRLIWLNCLGKRVEHSLGCRQTLAYARDWFRSTILECQGRMSIEERRNTQLRLLTVENSLDFGTVNL